MTPQEFQAAFFARGPRLEEVLELFEYLPGAYFYAKDREHRYIGVNRAVLKGVFGLERVEDLLGKTDRDFQPPALAEAYLGEDLRVMETGRALPNQVWFVPHVDGTPRWFVSSKTPLLAPDGEILGIAGVMYPIATPEDQAAHFGEIQPVIGYMEQHFRSAISMKEMAALAGLSSTHFNQRFRELLRLSPTEFLLRLRVQFAQQRLTETDRTLAEVAVEAGFCDQSHFTKRFRRVTGLTPRQYRKRFREG